MTSTIVLWALVLAAGTIFGWRSYCLLRPMMSAPAAARFDQSGLRLKGVLRALGLHERLLKFRYSGVLHAMIFASFFVLATAIVQSFGSVLFPGFTLRPIGGDTWIALLRDVFAVVMIAGVALAAWQRFWIRPARFKGSNAADASLIYVLILLIVLSMLLEGSFQIAAGAAAGAAWTPLSRAIAAILVAIHLSRDAAQTGSHVFYWIHVCAILGFLIYLPGSKHRHMLLAGPNVYFRDLNPKGQLPRGENGGPPASVHEIGQLPWKDMLDLYSCTECGRCQSVCPAYAAGLPLSPKMLITDLRDHLIGKSQGTDDRQLVGQVIKEETLWACTTCRACMEVCPVHIEHVPKIVGMRRHLIDEGHVRPMLQDALSNFQRTGNSTGTGARMRPRWTKELPFKIKDARKEPVDILWFVGDFASYDPRVQQVTREIAIMFNDAGVDFGILYDTEQNSGNDVRRTGEEGLFESLATQNIASLEGCTFNRIMTTDPHSLNALSQEYRLFGANYEVIHYSGLLLELIKSGRITLVSNAAEVVTYHDPCYLGRYNGGFDAPREVISRAGFVLQEMKRCRENSFCCGAGGGRIWADDTGVTERPSENRIKEALSLGTARYFVVTCPKDKVMYSAAVQALGVEDRIEVLDLAELVKRSQAPAEKVMAM
jgi:Fe-S oxidoreductase